MAMVMYSPDVAKPPPPPPLPPRELKTGAVVVRSTPAPASRVDVDSRVHHQQQRRQEEDQDGGGQVLVGIVLVLRAAAALSAFVSMALVASCRHGDWMEFPRYPEYRYLLGVSLVAFLYSAAMATRDFRRMRRRGGGAHAISFLGFAGDQAVAYLVVTAAAAATPITIRMRSAVVNVFTDAMAASIGLHLLAFAALAFSALLTATRPNTRVA